MTKRGVQKPKKKMAAGAGVKASPAELWGEGPWRIIKFVSALVSFGILLIRVTAYSRLGDAIVMSDVLPGFLVDVLLFIVGIFFMMSPYSPLRIYGKPKYRWLFGWIFFMCLASHFIANVIGLLMVGGIL